MDSSQKPKKTCLNARRVKSALNYKLSVFNYVHMPLTYTAGIFCMAQGLQGWLKQYLGWSG